MEKTLNPDVATRMRGVVEKCNFCHGRLHAARARAAAEGRRDLQPGEYVPACVEACPAGAIVFGDLNDSASESPRLSRDEHSFRILENLGTEPKIYYRTARPWVRQVRRAQPNRQKGVRSCLRTANDARAASDTHCATAKFLLWILPWTPLLFGLYGAGLCLVKGLNQTNMDNRFAFGLWIFLDLTVIALGAGAFFTGFLLYILKKQRTEGSHQ